MLRSIFILFLFLSLNQVLAQESFEHDGVIRQYLLHTPQGIQANAPLVFVLHGYTSRADVISSYSGMSRQADLHGFAVCYPQGTQDRGGITHWNANLTISDTDDVGFLTALAQHLQEEHNLSPDHTFSCGMSNGGFMSYTLACEKPEVFKAIASVTGTMSGYDWNNCDPSEVVPVFQISGLDDNVVPVDGSMSAFGGWGGAEGSVAVNDFWKSLNETTTEEVITLSSNLDAEYYTDGKNGNQVWYYPIQGWGHEWPGSWNQNITGIVAAEEIWKFFSLVISQTSSSLDAQASRVKIYPVPSEGILNLEGSLSDFKIYNLAGQVQLKGTLGKNSARVDISSLESGIYFINLGGNNLKFVKI